MNTSRCKLAKGTPDEADLVPTNEHFNCLKTYADESHLFRYLLECKDCGQLYFYEFYEEIDWEEGNDPQYTTYIPVETAGEAEELNKKSNLELLRVTPRLQDDFLQDGTKTIRWVK